MAHLRCWIKSDENLTAGLIFKSYGVNVTSKKDSA